MGSERRYDIDWIRVIAICLLMVYHVAIVFQPWGLMVGFMTNTEPWTSLWTPMSMLNVWRIPILFFISGLGVYFSFQNRNWRQLLKERVLRIGIPLLFGSLIIVPMYTLVLQYYYSWRVQYTPQTAHLWFLGNILIYVVISMPFFLYLKGKENNYFNIQLQKLFKSPFVFILIIGCFMAEVLIMKPAIYEMYANTFHGFFLGWLGFVFGYLFGYAGVGFWEMLIRYKWIFLSISIGLFYVRIANLIKLPYQVNLPMETCLWIFAIFGFGHHYLNRPYKYLSYLSSASYPVYILHMIFLGLTCSIILPVNMSVYLKFVVILMGTTFGSLLFYEVIVRRVSILRILFGLNSK